MSTIDWTQFEPKTIYDFVYASEEMREKIEAIVNGNISFPVAGVNGIILHGVWGTGKTTLAKILPDAIEKKFSSRETYYRYESIQSGNNGANIMVSIDHQTDIIPYASYHYIVLDEIDLLSSTAMSVLKSVMNKINTIFIMTTNNLNAVDPGVIDRSILIDFNAAPAEAWLPKVRQVLAAHNISVANDQILLPIIQAGKGSARKIMNGAAELAHKMSRPQSQNTP